MRYAHYIKPLCLKSQGKSAQRGGGGGFPAVDMPTQAGSRRCSLLGPGGFAADILTGSWLSLTFISAARAGLCRETFGEPFPLMLFMGAGDNEIMEIIRDCLEKGKNVCEAGYIDLDDDSVY